MTQPTILDVTEVVQTSVQVDDATQNFSRSQTNFTTLARCITALNPLGPDGPVDPNGDLTGIPLVFKTVTDEEGETQIVQANITSTDTFKASLQGLTILAGESVITSTSNPNAFGTSVGKGDALFALVDNPQQDLTNTTDWLRLEGDDSYSVTLSERQLLNTANETDTPVFITDASAETTVTFYLLSTAATVDGDLTGGQVGSFTQTTDDQTGILYIRMPSNYIPNTGTENLYVRIRNADGTQARLTPLTSYTERTDLLVGGDDVFESDDQPRDMQLGYLANQTVELWRVRISREWNFTTSLNLIPSIRDGSIDITKLSETTQTLLRTLQEHAIDDEELLQTVTSKVDALFPLTPDVDILDEWAGIYDPARATETVNIVPGYSLLADFRGTLATEHFESAGVTYTAGSGVSQYSGLTNDFHRCFGFRVSGPADQILLWIDDGGTLIPYIDITVGGNLRVNNYTPATTMAQVVTGDTRVVRTPTVGTGTLSVGGAVSTYTMPDYPASTTNQSRTCGVEFEVLVNGVDLGAGGGIDIPIPNDLSNQAFDTINHTFNLGPLHGNRQITATFGYEFRQSGASLLLDLTLENAPSDITMRVEDVAVTLAYTTTVAVARVDNFENLGDGLGDFTFSGDHEFLFAFHPFEDQGRMDAVPVAINTSTGAVTELNDDAVPLPTPGFNEIEVPDTIEFRTFLPNHFLRHDDLAVLLRDRTTKWAYALARLNEVTGHAITEAVDLFTGSTLNGEAIKSGADEVVHQATGTGTSAGELIQNVVLPADYTDFSVLHVTEFVSGVPNEWRTVPIDTVLLSTGDVGASDVIRIQGNTDFTWTAGSRTLTSQGGQTIYRAVLRTS